jgi:hypothetical protein
VGLPLEFLPYHQGDSILLNLVLWCDEFRGYLYRAVKIFFKVFSIHELHERFLGALAGAQSLSQVTDPNILALPALDEARVAQVLKWLEPPQVNPPPPRNATAANKNSCILS